MSKSFDVSRFVPEQLAFITGKNRGRSFDMEAALLEFEELGKLSAEDLDKMVEYAIEASRNYVMGVREQEAQMISFVWGNAPEGNQGTRETVRKNLGLLEST